MNEVAKRVLESSLHDAREQLGMHARKLAEARKDVSRLEADVAKEQSRITALEETLGHNK